MTSECTTDRLSRVLSFVAAAERLVVNNGFSLLPLEVADVCERTSVCTAVVRVASKS